VTEPAGGWSRRRVLALAAAGGAAALATALGLRLGGDDDSSPAAEPVAPPPSPDDATQAVGRRYLEAVPAEADADVLRGLLPEGLDSPASGEGADQVAAAVRADFAGGGTVELDGWVLSVTECRLAALSALS
jgi:hypothetical protein